MCGGKPATYKSVAGQSGAASGEPAAGGGSTVPATVGRRGSGTAPAQRSNLSRAHGSTPTTYKGEMAAQGGAVGCEHAAGGDPARGDMGRGWGGTAPAQGNNLSPAHQGIPAHLLE